MQFDHKRLEFIRRGGRVKRFHGFHLLMENTIGHHTYNVMGVLTCCLSKELLSTELLLAALHHDTAECVSGDMPAPFKRKIPGLREAMAAEEERLLALYDIGPFDLTEHEKVWLKMADSLDGAMHCLEERRLGNTTLDRLFWEFMGYVDELIVTGSVSGCPAIENFANVASFIERQWEHAGGSTPSQIEEQPHS